MGVHVANFMDHGSSKTPAGLGSTQTTLLEYHMQEWIGHMHYTCMQDAVSWENGPARAAVSFHNSLGKVGFIPGPVAGGFHLVCIQRAKNNNILKAHNFL